MQRVFAISLVIVVCCGACISSKTQPWTPVPADLPSDVDLRLRPLLDTEAFDPAERNVVRAVAAEVRRTGGDPAEQYVVGAVEHSIDALRIEVLHVRDLTPECRHVLGDCSGWQRIYELDPKTEQVARVLHVQ